MSFQCYALQEDKTGQGVAQHSGFVVTLESHGTLEHAKEGYKKIHCVNVLLCSNVLQMPNAKVSWIY